MKQPQEKIDWFFTSVWLFACLGSSFTSGIALMKGDFVMLILGAFLSGFFGRAVYREIYG